MTSSVPDRAKVNVKPLLKLCLLRLIEECQSLPPSAFIFQQDDAPAHTAKLTQHWVVTNCSEFIGKGQWPPNSPVDDCRKQLTWLWVAGARARCVDPMRQCWWRLRPMYSLWRNSCPYWGRLYVTENDHYVLRRVFFARWPCCCSRENKTASSAELREIFKRFFTRTSQQDYTGGKLIGNRSSSSSKT